MTRKDFEAIAAVIKRSRPDGAWDKLSQYGKGRAYAADDIAAALANVCAETNPRFDRQRFLEACNAKT